MQEKIIKVTVPFLQSMKKRTEKITMLTAYDASFAKLLSACGVEVILVGDSLGMVVAGYDTTVPVMIDDIIYHTTCVARAKPNACIMADMPFMSYNTLAKAVENAAKLLQAGAAIVKLEGGAWLAPIISELTEKGIPVCAHIGLSAQAINITGNYKIRGRHAEEAERIFDDAVLLEEAGAKLLLLECIPHTLAKKITEHVSIPTIGIGAGPECDGQVLVTADILGITPGKPYTFTQNFLVGRTDGIPGAIKAYVEQVKQSLFPTLEHSFS